MAVAFYLCQSRNHNFAEIPLILGIESHNGSFVSPNYRLTGSDNTLVRLCGQLVGQK
jgi:hypothetical protein